MVSSPSAVVPKRLRHLPPESLLSPSKVEGLLVASHWTSRAREEAVSTGCPMHWPGHVSEAQGHCRCLCRPTWGALAFTGASSAASRGHACGPRRGGWGPEQTSGCPQGWRHSLVGPWKRSGDPLSRVRFRPVGKAGRVLGSPPRLCRCRRLTCGAELCSSGKGPGQRREALYALCRNNQLFTPLLLFLPVWNLWTSPQGACAVMKGGGWRAEGRVGCRLASARLSATVGAAECPARWGRAW